MARSVPSYAPEAQWFMVFHVSWLFSHFAEPCNRGLGEAMRPGSCTAYQVPVRRVGKLRMAVPGESRAASVYSGKHLC